MYLFKNELKKELLKGRTITYIADLIGVTPAYLTAVLNRKKTCSKLVAYVLCKIFDENIEIDDCFERVSKNE